MVGDGWDRSDGRDAWSDQGAPASPPVKGAGRWAPDDRGGPPGRAAYREGAYSEGAYREGAYRRPPGAPGPWGHGRDEPGEGDRAGWTQPGQLAPPGWDPSGEGTYGHDPSGQGPWSQGPWGRPGGPWPGYSPVPPRRRGPHPVLLVGLALALFLVVGVVAAVVLAGSSSDDESSSGSGGAEALQPASDVELVPYEHPGGSYSVSTPAGWVTTPVEGDLAGLGTEMFPDDPRLAEAFDRGTQTMPRSIVFVSMDRADMEGGRFTTNLAVARVSGMPVDDLDALEGVLRREIEAFGDSEVTGQSRVETPAGEASRMEYELPMPGVSGIQYGLLIDGDVWSFAYTSDDLPDDEGVADAIAATFDVP